MRELKKQKNLTVLQQNITDIIIEKKKVKGFLPNPFPPRIKVPEVYYSKAAVRNLDPLFPICFFLCLWLANHVSQTEKISF